ncbi:unnamed protein product [Brassica oleracea]
MFADKYLSFSLGLCCLQPGKTLKMAGCLFTQEGFLDIGKKTLKSNESYKGGSIHRLEEKCGSSRLGVMIQRALLKKESKSDNVQGNWYSTKIKGICLSFGTFFLALLYAWIDNDVGYCQGIRRSDREFRLQVSVIYVAAHTSASIARDSRVIVRSREIEAATHSLRF